MAHDLYEPLPQPKTSLYYDAEGRCEAAYVQFREGRPVEKVEPDPHYLVTLYYGANRVLLGVGIDEPVPDAVIVKALAMMGSPPDGYRRQLRHAGASLSVAA